MTAVRATAPSRGVRLAVRSTAETAWSRRHEPRAQWLVALALAFLAATAAFGHVVEDYLTGDPIVRWDVDLARWLHEHSSPALVDVFDVVTWAGNAIVLGLLTAVVLAVLIRRRALEQAMLLVGVAGGIEILNAPSWRSSPSTRTRSRAVTRPAPRRSTPQWPSWSRAGCGPAAACSSPSARRRSSW